MAEPIQTRTFSNIQLKRGLASAWSVQNPILFAGEVGIESDTNKIKIGDGVTAWNSLPYFSNINKSVKAASPNVSFTLSGTITLDGVVLSVGDRVLVKNQATASQNGIYIVSSGAWTRAYDANTTPEIVGSFVFVEGGTLNAGSTWTTDFSSSGIVGTTAMNWYQLLSTKTPVTLASGGTNASLTAVSGGVVYSTGSAMAISSAGTAGQALISNGAAAPTWKELDLADLPGAAFKKSVRAATTANITLSGTQTIDGIALVAGDRVLVKNQTTASQNGIYTVSASTWTRPGDAALSSEMGGAVVNVDSGTQGGQLWTTSFKTTDTIGTTAMNWFQVVDTSRTASTTVAGIVELATDAETQTGTDATRAVTPASHLSYHLNEGSGTTTQRDARFGIPVTTADIAALANRRVIWYNTEEGWMESYYATTGTAGLSVRGLTTGNPSGWYPVGQGPYIRLQPTSAFSAVANNPIRSWGTAFRSGGTAWFSYSDTNGRISIPRGGRYQVRAQTTQQNGNGTANYHLRVLNSGSYEQHIDGVAFTLVSNLYTLAHAEMEIAILPGRQVDLFIQSGTLAVHQSGGSGIRGEFLIRYVAPPLVID